MRGNQSTVQLCIWGNHVSHWNFLSFPSYTAGSSWTTCGTPCWRERTEETKARGEQVEGCLHLAVVANVFIFIGFFYWYRTLSFLQKTTVAKPVKGKGKAVEKQKDAEDELQASDWSAVWFICFCFFWCIVHVYGVFIINYFSPHVVFCFCLSIWSSQTRLPEWFLHKTAFAHLSIRVATYFLIFFVSINTRTQNFFENKSSRLNIFTIWRSFVWHLWQLQKIGIL